MRNSLFAITLAFMSCSAHAEGKSAIQIEDKIRVVLKDIYMLEQASYAHTAAYKTTLSDLNYALPSTLADLVKTTIKVDKSGPVVQMVGTKAPIQGRTYSIDASGTIQGLAQYSANKEVNAEIDYLVKTSEVALKAYYDEWGTYTSDLKKLGIVVPEHLNRFGNLKITVEGSHYHVEFQSIAAAASEEASLAAKAIEDINRNLGTETHPFFINVSGEMITGDDGTIDPNHAAKYLRETCEKYQNQEIRKAIRSRTLAMLRQMDAVAIQNDVDDEASADERTKILSERKRIRAELTALLNKDCR